MSVVRSVIDTFRSQLATWIVAFFIGILTIFSSSFTEKIKFAVNKADLRTKYYEELVSDVSAFRFESEFLVEEVEHNRTTKSSLDYNVPDYNNAVSKLRKKEWVYRSWIKRYWGEKEQAESFSQYMNAVKAFDTEVRGLNDEIEAVENKQKVKFDPNTAEAATQRLKPALTKVQETSTDLIHQLDKSITD